MDESKIIKPPDTLRKAKVGDGPVKFDTKAIAEAEAAVAAMVSNYSVWLLEDLELLENTLEELRAKPANSKKLLKKILTVVLDMKGQGGSFGYDMITKISDSLVKFIEGYKEATDKNIKVIAQHVHSMRTVFSNEIRGDGGQIGQELIQRLRELRSKKG